MHTNTSNAHAHNAAILGLRLCRFRSYSDLRLDCPPTSIIITGANGAGKTNILEAISLIGDRRGLRKAQSSDFAHNDSPYWAIAADITDTHSPLTIQIQYRNAAREVKIDGATIDSQAQSATHLPQLWLTPAMDRLFTDTASERRRFFDRFTCGLTHAHQHHLTQYTKAMRERNRLLTTESLTKATARWLDGLEETMAAHGMAVAAARLHALDTLTTWTRAQPPPFPRAEITIEGEIEADLCHRDATEVEMNYRAQLSTMRLTDAAARRTLKGVHCSDLVVFHAERQIAAKQCSTGEQKALLIALILAQAQSMRAKHGRVPILLLDEIAAHLDTRARAALATALEHIACQAWITGSDAYYFSDFGNKITRFHLENGKLN